MLGVPRDASPAVIRKAYLKLALTSHPDKGGSVEVGSPVSSVVSEASRAGVPPRPGGLRVAARRQSKREVTSLRKRARPPTARPPSSVALQALC